VQHKHTHCFSRNLRTQGKNSIRKASPATSQGGLLAFSIPLKPTLHRLVKKFQSKVSLLIKKKKKQETRRVLSQETLNNTEP